MTGFITWLEEKSASRSQVRAVLRRSLAFKPGTFAPSFPYVEPFIRGSTNEWHRSVLYLLAGLWAAHYVEGRKGTLVSLGKACAAHIASGGSTSTEQRFITLLDSDTDQLPHRLRQIVMLLKDQPIDFEDMYYHLLSWGSPEDTGKISWARDFYQGYENSNAEITNQTEENTL